MSNRDSIRRAVDFAADDIADHHEFSENEEFNRKLDEGDLGEYIVSLQKPDGASQPIESASKALFFSDRATYRTMLSEYREGLRYEVLRTSDFPENEASYERLKNVIRSGATVVPFIGAGFSVAAGCPSWSEYIVSQAGRARMDEREVRRRLSAGEHELVMDEVISALKIARFQRDFRSDFEGGGITPVLSPSAEFVDLLNGSMITTNFDRVLEDCHSDQRRPFKEKVIGDEDTGRFIKAIYSGEKYLLKLHGNIDDQRHRVLTRAEYELRYGANGFDPSLQIPKILNKIFSSFTVLFCGCSLIADRYLQVLKTAYDANSEYIPDHFAILTAPEDDDEKNIRDQFLAGHGITPIWYSAGDWDAPKEILQLLKSDS